MNIVNTNIHVWKKYLLLALNNCTTETIQHGECQHINLHKDIKLLRLKQCSIRILQCHLTKCSLQALGLYVHCLTVHPSVGQSVHPCFFFFLLISFIHLRNARPPAHTQYNIQYNFVQYNVKQS